MEKKTSMQKAYLVEYQHVTYIQNIQFHYKVTKLFANSFWRKTQNQWHREGEKCAYVCMRVANSFALFWVFSGLSCVVCSYSMLVHWQNGLPCSSPTISRKQEHRTTTKLQKENKKKWIQWHNRYAKYYWINGTNEILYCIVLDRIVFHLKLHAVEAIWLFHWAYFNFCWRFCCCCCSVCLSPLFWCSFSVGSWILEFRCCAICI